MGLFDSIYAELECPVTHERKLQEIQIKWNDPSMCEYKIGDDLGIHPNMDNLWVKKDYLCVICIDDLKWHNAYINLKKGVLSEVISESEFKSRGLEEYLDHI